MCSLGNLDTKIDSLINPNFGTILVTSLVCVFVQVDGRKWESQLVSSSERALACVCWFLEVLLRAVREKCVLTRRFIVILRSKLDFMVLLLAHTFSVLVELDSFIKIYPLSCIFSAHSFILCSIIVQWYIKKIPWLREILPLWHNLGKWIWSYSDINTNY